VNRRGILKTAMAAAATTLGLGRFATPAQAQTNHNYRFELEFENEELRQKWIASAAHQRVWPLVEKTITTQKTYPVVLYDEV
jgi:hypothetical protein